MRVEGESQVVVALLLLDHGAEKDSPEGASTFLGQNNSRRACAGVHAGD